MKVPFFDSKRLYIEQKSEIDRSTLAILKSGRYLYGTSERDFERNFARTLVKRATLEGRVVSCHSGTDALVLSLIAGGIGYGNEVLTVSHTALPTVAAIKAVGASVAFAEIHPDTWVLDPKQVKHFISASTQAVIAVHLYGNMVQIDELRRELDHLNRKDIWIIEDVAQAYSSKLNGKPAGTLARMGAYSFYPTKNLGGMGDGGAVFCRTKQDHDAVKMLANYGKSDRNQARLERGINSRLGELQAAILNLRIGRVAKWNRIKANQMQVYRNALAGLPLEFQQVTRGCQPAWHLCVIRLESKPVRDALMAYLRSKGIETMVHYPISNHRQLAFKNKTQASLPVTDSLTKRILSLPMNPCLLPKEQDTVIRAIQLFFRGR